MRASTTALAAALAGLALMGSAAAADYTVGDITIKDPWARATVGAGAGAAFLSIDNAGSVDRLVGATSPVAKTAELHTHIKDGDVMRMRPIDAIDIPGKATTTLKPGGLHIMLLGLSAPLVAGQPFPLTLRFAEAGEVTANVEVKNVAAMGGAPAGHGAMGGHDEPAESGY